MQSIPFRVPSILNEALPPQNQSRKPSFGRLKKPLNNSESTMQPSSPLYHYHPVQFAGNDKTKDRTDKIKKEYLPKLIKGLPKTDQGHTITMADFDFSDPIPQLKYPSRDECRKTIQDISRNLMDTNNPSIKVIFIEHEETGNWEKDIATMGLLNLLSHIDTENRALSLDELESFLNPNEPDRKSVASLLFPVGDTGNKTLTLIGTDLDKMKVLNNEFTRQAVIRGSQHHTQPPKNK